MSGQATSDPTTWTAADVSYWPTDCRVTDACGEWIDKQTNDLFVALFEDVERGSVHGYRVWGEGDVQMWHCADVARLLALYRPKIVA